MGFFHTWIVIYQNFRKNTRWVTEVTGVTEVVIELLTQEADWLPVTRVTAVTPVTSVTARVFFLKFRYITIHV